MNKYMQALRVMGAGLILSVALLGCLSKSESAGNDFLKAGDPVNAIAQYEIAMQGTVSEAFYANYTKAYLLLMQARSDEDPGSEALEALKDTVLNVLSQHPNSDVALQAANTLVDVGQKRLKLETPAAEESAFQFFMAADSISGKSPDIESKFADAKQKYVADKLKDVESKLNDATSDATAGIVAEYELNQMALAMGGETPEMKDLSSRVHAKNLDMYLLYSAPGLIEQLDSRINKYGMLLAITKYTAAAGQGSVKIEAKVWNQTSGAITIDASNFQLVDRNGTAYDPAQKLGAFTKKTLVEVGKESGVGGLTFNLPKDAEPDYLLLKVDDGRESRKYLP